MIETRKARRFAVGSFSPSPFARRSTESEEVENSDNPPRKQRAKSDTSRGAPRRLLGAPDGEPGGARRAPGGGARRTPGRRPPPSGPARRADRRAEQANRAPSDGSSPQPRRKKARSLMTSSQRLDALKVEARYHRERRDLVPSQGIRTASD